VLECARGGLPHIYVSDTKALIQCHCYAVYGQRRILLREARPEGTDVRGLHSRATLPVLRGGAHRSGHVGPRGDAGPDGRAVVR